MMLTLDRVTEILALLDEEYDVRQTIRDRIRAYVDARVYRADIVQQLPAQSDPGRLYVMAGDPNLYIGAQGGGYRRVPTQAV